MQIYSKAKMKKVNKDKITSMMRSSVLTLCKDNFKCAIEIDGLICISVLNSTEQHVVKIHDLLTESGQFVAAMSLNSLNPPSVDTRTDLLTCTSPVDNSPQPVLVVPNSATSTQKTTVNSRPTSSFGGMTSGSRNRTNNSDDNISRFPFLVQTLKESQRNQQRAASASPTMLGQGHTTGQGQQNKSLYSNLSNSSPLVDTDRPASSLLKMLSSQKQQQASQHSYNSNLAQEPGQDQTALTKQQNDNIEEQNQNLIINVKKEPVDINESFDQPQMNVTMETDDTLNQASHTETEQTEVIAVKKEPEWNSNDYGGKVGHKVTDKSLGQDVTEKSVGQKVMERRSNDNSATVQKHSKVNLGNISTEDAERRKSILANILEGKEGAYTKDRTAVGSPSSKDICDEPDSSLLYRLPYTDFKDLFPASSNITDKRKSGGQGQSKGHGKKGKSELDKVMRQMLEDKKSARAKRQPPRKKKKTVYYEEFDSMSSDSDGNNSLDLVSEEENDESYTPQGYEQSELGVSKGSEPDFTMSLRNKKVPVNKAPRRAVAVKSTTKQVKLPQENLRYACYHCQLRFKTSEERDEHEESKCAGEHGLIECDVCKGYFANSSSKNKHMFEIHLIVPEEDKEDGQMPGKTMEQNSYEFETLRSSCESEGDKLRFDVNASSLDKVKGSSMELVTKFIVPYPMKNNRNFIKCPLCFNMFSDNATIDQHLTIKHKIANQIVNGDGTLSLQVRERSSNHLPPVYVKYEQTDND